MQIKCIKSNSAFSFGRKLRSDEKADFMHTLSEGKKVVGQDGKSIFIVHDACLPQYNSTNTGVGNLASKEADDFFDFVKTYMGINSVEVLPQTELKFRNGYACSYSASSLSLSPHLIDLELLTTSEFQSILTPYEYRNVVISNISDTKTTLANFENVIPDNSPFDSALKSAFRRFNSLGDDNPLKKEFAAFKGQNDDWLEPKTIFNILKNKNGTPDFYSWPQADRDLYSLDKLKRSEIIKKLSKGHEDEIDFYKFKQFLASKHLELGRKKLNEKGLKLFGDCLYGFSYDEVWANPSAFIKDHLGAIPSWGVPALNFDDIEANEASCARKLFEKKVELCAKRYDSIRLDVGWGYVFPITTPRSDRRLTPENVDFKSDRILKIYENIVKKVKGRDFDASDLIYEFETGPIPGVRLFSGARILPELQRLTKIYTSVYMNENWGSNHDFIHNRGWNPTEFIIGVGNHDTQPLRQIASGIKDVCDNNANHKNSAILALSRIFNIPQEVVENPIEFAKFKFAESMMAHNNQVFYMDAFGRQERFNCHSNRNVKFDYRYKISQNFEDEYINSIKEGFAFSPMDSLERIFKLKGYDKTHSELYKKITKYRDILLKDEPKISQKSKGALAFLGTLSTVISLGTFALIRNKKPKKDFQKAQQDLINSRLLN